MDDRQPELELASPADPEAVALIRELDELMNSLYRPEDNHLTLDPREVEGDRGAFVICRLEGEAVGCGAVRMLADGQAEVKRMYVRPSERGGGAGRAILARLETEAASRGATALVLEMGDSQPAAAGLYEAFGFRPVPCWSDYLATPNSLCLGKPIAQRSA